jgi:hypothetical protein
MIRHWILEGRLSASQEELLVGFGKEQDSRKLRVRKLEDHLKVRVIALAGMHCPYHHCWTRTRRGCWSHTAKAGGNRVNSCLRLRWLGRSRMTALSWFQKSKTLCWRQ